MTINLTVPDDNETPRLKPKLTVIGVGGAGGNAVNNMIRSELEGVDFVVANTDAQALTQSKAERRIQMGVTITEGLGAGSRPEVGRAAAEEAIEEIHGQLDGAHMVFIAAGMGGGTGTGGAPVVARAARENGILTVGVVTKPFHFEGTHRMRQAEEGIAELEQYVDTLIVIPNQNLFRIANEKTTFADAFAMADQVLYSGVRGVTDLMVMPGLINLDFADIRSVMSEMGKAMMGTGEAEGERRALDAAEAAIANPLLDETSMKGAKGVLINITGGMDITLFEVDEAANRIRAEVDQDAYIIVGSAFDSELDGIMRVSVVATGIDADASEMPLPTMLHLAEQLDYSSVSEPTPETGTEDVVEADADVEVVAEADAEDHSPGAAAELPVESMVEAVGESVDQTVDDSAGEESEPETPPAAMPAVGASDAFIPPRPVEATPGGEPDEAGHQSVAAPADDDAPETSPEPPKRAKATSLFERVTGTGLAAFGRKGMAPEKEAEVTKDKELSVTDGTKATTPDVDGDEAAKVAVPDESADAGDEKPRLGGVDPADRGSGGDSEEDLLDIPAFLRRQAN